MKHFFKCFLLLLFVLANTSYSQIIYNKAKPLSYGNAALASIDKIPVIDFLTDENNFIAKSELNIDIKEFAISEKTGESTISRVAILIKSKKLGEITLSFNDINLNNQSKCFIYTDDYSIVAGPIFQNSINKTLDIVNIPANKIIVEVISETPSDFDLKLDAVSFMPVNNKAYSKSKYNQIQSVDYCNNCQHGVLSYNDDIDVTNCAWLGGGDETFKYQKYGDINDYAHLNASRSACVIMRLNENGIYHGSNGTLVNFPYADCNSSLDCKKSFVVTVHHEVDSIVKSQIANDYSYLDKVIFRFNWHRKYGTPWHLSAIACDDNTPANYQAWRNTIDFSEVIDYCGARVFAYNDANAGDMAILNIQQKLFYKEHHLGWTLQGHFDIEQHNYTKVTPTNDGASDPFYLSIGKKGFKPTGYLENYHMKFEYFHDINQLVPGKFRYTAGKRSNGDILPYTSFEYSGFSGSIVTIPDYINPEQRIGAGLFKAAGGEHNPSNGGMQTFEIEGRTFHDLLQYIEDGGGNSLTFDLFRIFDDCYFSEVPTSFGLNYTNTQVISSQFLSRDVTFQYEGVSRTINIRWMPSIDNAMKCQSKFYSYEYPDSTEIHCDLDITDFVSYSIEDSLCVVIDGIQETNFSPYYMPKGVRIFIDYGDQKTLYFKSFFDNQSISFPIDFCMSKCDMLYFQSLGLNDLPIKVAFYDDYGNVINVDNCWNLYINIPLPPSCDLLGLSAAYTKLGSKDSCCYYKIDLNFNPCSADNPAVKNAMDNLSFSTSVDSPIMLKDIANVTKDFVNGKYSFEYKVCNNPQITNIIANFASGGTNCASLSIPVEDCLCSCPDSSSLYGLLEIIKIENSTACPPGYCAFSAKLNIPDSLNCYKYYKVNGSLNKHNFKMPVYPDGSLNSYTRCIAKGTSVTDTFRLYKNQSDTTYCLIIKTLGCPNELTSNSPCDNGCDDPWDNDILTLDFNDCPDCKVYVEYRYRNNYCSGSKIQEIQILKFFAFNPNGNSLPACCAITASEMYKKLLKKIIYLNRMDFDPKYPPLCSDIWRVLHTSCWISYKDPNVFSSLDGGATVYKPCDTTDCCSIRLRVCRMEDSLSTPFNPYISITTLSSSSNLDTCSQKQTVYVHYPNGIEHNGTLIYYLPSTMQCMNRCDWLEAINDNAFYGKKSENEDKLIINELSYGVNIKVLQNNDYLIINADSQEFTNNFKVSINSIQGNLLVEKQIPLNKGENQLSLNTSSLISGVYVITFVKDGVVIKTEKYMIVR